MWMPIGEKHDCKLIAFLDHCFPSLVRALAWEFLPPKDLAFDLFVFFNTLPRVVICTAFVVPANFDLVTPIGTDQKQMLRTSLRHCYEVQMMPPETLRDRKDLVRVEDPVRKALLDEIKRSALFIGHPHFRTAADPQPHSSLSLCSQ